jgi:hypothetical protein
MQRVSMLFICKTVVEPVVELGLSTGSRQTQPYKGRTF